MSWAWQPEAPLGQECALDFIGSHGEEVGSVGWGERVRERKPAWAVGF